MTRMLRFLSPLALLAAATPLFSPFTLAAQTSVAEDGLAVPWDAAFPDRSANTPLHFVARYVDGAGKAHRLEEWRVGTQHLRRRTDDRIDLHADAVGRTLPGQPTDYLWQILDLQKHIAHRVSTVGMLRLGMLYSYYSMAHLMTRPAGQFTVRRVSGPLPKLAGVDAMAMPTPAKLPACTWWQIDAPGQPSTRACWMPAHGLPAELWSQSPGGWRRTFAVESLETHAIPPRTFATDTAGFQVRSVDELEAED